GPFDPGVARPHHRGGRGAVVQAESVAYLVHRHGLQVVGRADAVGPGRVEIDVAGDREVVDRGRHEGLPQVTGAVAVGPEADVAHARVALLIGALARGGAVVGDDGEVDVGVLRPGLGGLEDLGLPDVGRVAAVEPGEHVAVRAAPRAGGDQGSVRHEAQG